jgi:protein TonB
MTRLIFLVLALFCFHQVNAQNLSIPAEFPGGENAWNRYLDTSFNRQVIISQSTKKDIERFGRAQRVQYNFGIMQDGSIGLITIEGQVSQSIRNEINRVLRTAPKWTPATVNGAPVVYRQKQVSIFTLE